MSKLVKCGRMVVWRLALAPPGFWLTWKRLLLNPMGLPPFNFTLDRSNTICKYLLKFIPLLIVWRSLGCLLLKIYSFQNLHLSSQLLKLFVLIFNDLFYILTGWLELDILSLAAFKN
jgi:hypothetical protein